MILEPNSKRLKHELHFPAEQVQRIRVQPPPMAQKPKKVPVWLGTLAHLLFRQQVIFCNKSSRLRVSEPKSQVAFRFISPTSRSFTGWFAYKSSRLRISSPTSHLAYRPVLPTNRSSLPGASIPIVPLSQPCPVSFYFYN